MHSKSSNQMQWVKGNEVGNGSFGVVNLAMNKSNGHIFVVKSAPSGAGFEALENEVRILETLDSPHIVLCLGHELSCEPNGQQKFHLFMEFMAGGSLSDIVNKFGGALDESIVRLYTRKILQGLSYLHRRGIVHCDLKCKNVLVGSSGSLKLADFGAAKILNSTNSKNSRRPICGTPLWMAPEVLRNEQQDYSCDIWSLGCTIIEMATGRPPWGGNISNPMAAIYKIACSDETPQLPAGFSAEGLDFLRKCLHRDPKMRWTSDKLLRHPFISPSSAGNCSNCHNSWSPTSVLAVGDWDSDGEELVSRLPFSKRSVEGDGHTRRDRIRESGFDSTSDNWIVVRSS